MNQTDTLESSEAAARHKLRWILMIVIGLPLVVIALVVAADVGDRSQSGSSSPILPMFLAYCGPIAILVGIAALVHISRSLRRRRGLTVLMYVEQAVRLNMPLPQLLMAGARAETGKTRLRLARLANAVGGGVELGLALEATVPELHGRLLRIVQGAQNLGHLPQALRQLVTEQRQSDRDAVTDRMFMVIYPLGMTLLMTFLLSMLMVFVVPKYEQIFKDFKTPLPQLTQIMLKGTALPVATVAVLSVLLFISYVLSQLAEVIWPTSMAICRSVTDRVAWWTPIVGRLIRNRGLADVFGMAGQAVRDGYSLDRALAQAATLDVNRSLASRIGRWQRAVEDGAPLPEAARQAGMPALAVGMLSTAQATGQAGEVFRFLSTYYGEKFSRAVILLRAAVVPVMAIGFGILVALVCLSLLLPMVQLINTMTMFPRMR